jgi:hypothetical protein
MEISDEITNSVIKILNIQMFLQALHFVKVELLKRFLRYHYTYRRCTPGKK